MKMFKNTKSKINTKKWNAYSFLEVSITIVIIAIIIAITLPDLIQYTKKSNLVSNFLKTNDILSKVFDEANIQKNINNYDENSFKNIFSKYLEATPCNGNNICLKNGIKIKISNFDSSCSTKGKGDNKNLEQTCAALTIDINGEKKPNKKGVDRYLFYVTKNGVFPAGSNNYCNGLDCSAYVAKNYKLYDFSNNKLNFLEAEKPPYCSDMFISRQCTLLNGEVADKIALSMFTFIPKNETGYYYFFNPKLELSYNEASEYCTALGLNIPKDHQLFGLANSGNLNREKIYWSDRNWIAPDDNSKTLVFSIKCDEEENCNFVHIDSREKQSVICIGNV